MVYRILKFCYDGIGLLGIKVTRMLLHIDKSLHLSPDRFAIVTAYVEGKTFITNLYAAWTLIRDPRKIVLIYHHYLPTRNINDYSLSEFY